MPSHQYQARISFNPRSRTGSDSRTTLITDAQRRFNPRSRTGSDPRLVYQAKPYNRFQSTLPHGERQTLSSVSTLSIKVSIHAPARGATCNGSMLSAFAAGFNPRSRTGSDVLNDRESARISLFQSTLPHGERLILISTDGVLVTFQSTLPHGERPICPDSWFEAIEFQSTLPHGERPTHQHHQQQPVCVSIHAPARGATFIRAQEKSEDKGFNPRSRTGSDIRCRQVNTIDLVFQSTLPHGERLGDATP